MKPLKNKKIEKIAKIVQPDLYTIYETDSAADSGRSAHATGGQEDSDDRASDAAQEQEDPDRSTATPATAARAVILTLYHNVWRTRL